MAEMVSSAVIQESVSQILTGLVEKYEDKKEINGIRNIERLEMAHIRLEAAIETSNKWQITDTSMLRWQKKLKRAAQECDEKLHKCKQRILEEERMEQEWQVSNSFYSKRRTSLSEDTMSLQNSPYLKAGIAFAPHGSSEDMLPVNKCSETVEIVGGQQHVLHTDISLEQLEEIMLARAVDYFCHNGEAAVYQMIWRSKHGAARIHVEKPSINIRRTSMRAHRTFGGPRNRKLLRGQDQKIENFLGVLTHFLDLWGAHVPIRLQSSLMDWMQKQKEAQFVERKAKPVRNI